MTQFVLPPKVDGITRQPILPGTKLIDLDMIGVPPEFHNKWPVVQGYPTKFNPFGLPLWILVLSDTKFVRSLHSGSVDLAWHNTVLEFIERCADSGIFPFSNVTDTTRNEYIQDYLRRGRIILVRFMNESGMFTRLRVKRAYREYVRTDSGLNLVSWADCYPITDRNFSQWLQTSPMPRYLRGTDSRFVKILQPHIQSWVRCINPARPTIGFSIEVFGTVNIPGNKTPKREEVDAFLDTQMWLPIIKAHRFDNVVTRLF